MRLRIRSEASRRLAGIMADVSNQPRSWIVQYPTTVESPRSHRQLIITRQTDPESFHVQAVPRSRSRKRRICSSANSNRSFSAFLDTRIREVLVFGGLSLGRRRLVVVEREKTKTRLKTGDEKSLGWWETVRRVIRVGVPCLVSLLLYASDFFRLYYYYGYVEQRRQN